MAEVLGILGSSIAVTQLASGVVGGIPKLRQLWREFRDLPRDIDDTLEELEILGQSLLVIQNSVKSNAANAASATIVERSLEFCQTATKDLDKLMMDLRIENQSTSVKRQKIKLQAIMQKSEIHDVRERLQRAVRYLNLAVNCYSMTVQSQQCTTIAHAPSHPLKCQPTNSDKSTSTGATNPGATKIVSLRNGHLRQSHRSLGFATVVKTKTVKFPLWGQRSKTGQESEGDTYEEWRLIPMAWLRLDGICMSRATSLGKWQYSLKAIRVLESDSEIFKMCANGEVGQIIQLLRSKVATLADTNERGETLLHISALYNQPRMTRWLLEQGADVDAWTNNGMTPLHYASLAYYNKSGCYDTIKSLIADGGADITIDMGGEPLSTAVHVFHGPLEAFKYITNAMHGVYEIMDYTLAWQCGNCYGEQPTSYVRSAFDKSSISPERALLVDEQCGTQRTLLHAVAANLADSVIVPFDAGDTLHILKLLLDVHVDLHPRDKYGATPLDYLCYGTHHFVGTINEEKYELAVHQWLQMLHSRGLDLHEYAKQEARLHPNGNLIHCRQIRKGVRRKILFRYGDMSDNLEISVKDKREDAPLEELIPGSWPDVDNDGRDIIDHSETTPGWDLVFEPLVSGGVE